VCSSSNLNGRAAGGPACRICINVGTFIAPAAACLKIDLHLKFIRGSLDMFFAKIPLRAWFATLALGCFGLVAVGMAMQNLLHLAPCPMCIFQRLLYLVIGSLALFGFLWPVVRLAWAGSIALLALLGAGVAGYQSWMQAFPELATACGYADPNIMERLVDWLGMQWPSLFLATGFCTSRDWVFLDLSMANWSLLVFIGIAGYAALLIKHRG
jgi:disulfide bond formation protein DsbB